MRLRRVLSIAGALSVSSLLVSEAQAQLCSVSATAIGFGNYNVYDTGDIDMISTVTVTCVVGTSVRVRLDRGQFAPSFSPRQMDHGGDRLNYNLYFDAAHTQIWGDTSAGTVEWDAGLVLLIGKSHSVFGRLFPLQNVTVGGYTDTVVVTAIF
jgi:spore coat protein U-like protein